MKLIAIADDDSLVGKLPAEEGKCDVLLCLGDLTDTALETAFLRYRPAQAFGVKGNHDSAGPFPDFITPLHMTLDVHDRVLFGGFGGSWRYKPRGHHLHDQDEVTTLLRPFPRVDVFIAHNSPRGCHERDTEVHQGFDAFIDYIHRAKPRLFLHGHQHLDATTWIGETLVLGVFGERTIELDL